MIQWHSISKYLENSIHKTKIIYVYDSSSMRNKKHNNHNLKIKFYFLKLKIMHIYYNKTDYRVGTNKFGDSRTCSYIMDYQFWSRIMIKGLCARMTERRKKDVGELKTKTITRRTKIILLLLGFRISLLLGFIMRTICTTTNCIISTRNKKQKNKIGDKGLCGFDLFR